MQLNGLTKQNAVNNLHLSKYISFDITMHCQLTHLLITHMVTCRMLFSLHY